MLTKLLTVIFMIICVSHIVPGQYTNVRISSPSSTTPEEVSIAINPTNPLNLAAGANLNFYYYSNDGGSTWIQGNLTSSTYGVWGDPCVVYDASGNLFFGHLSNPPSPGYWIDRIVVQKSTNGGQTWNNGSGIFFNSPKEQDKEWLTVDMTNSPYHNYLYATWTEFDSYGSSSSSDSSRILFSRSTDAGTTWLAAVRLSDRGGNCIDEDNTVEGAVPAVGPNGEIYTSWSGPLGIMFDKSTDGGLTWGADIYVTSQPGGWDYAISGIYRANGLPITACDVSNSPYRGTIYIQWTDQRNGTENTDVFIIKSTNGGETWGSVKKVNDDATTRQQFFSWMTIDQSTGYVYVSFYDRRGTTGNATDYYVARSTDGGETFTNFKVSASSFTPTSSIFFGDYSCIAALNGKVYPIWMRLDGSNLSVWTALVDDRYQVSLSMSQKWNMVSVPLLADDFRKSILFPSAVSPAYGYDGNYVIKDTLALGSGYWLKYPSTQSVQLRGSPLYGDTVHVNTGWNLIGSISKNVPVNAINAIPPGIVVSDYYRFNGIRYVPVDTLLPGSAYWVKSSQDGQLVLGSLVLAQTASTAVTAPSHEYVFSSSENTISYEVSKKGAVTLKLFEREGEAIATLVDGIKEAGTYPVKLDPAKYVDRTYYYWLNILPVEKGSEPILLTGKVKIRE